MENGLKIDTIATADVVFAGSKHIVDKANDENKDFSPRSNPKRTKKKKKKSIRRDDNLIVSTSTSFATTSSSDTQSDCVTPTLTKSILSSPTETASEYTKSKVVKKTKGLVEGRKISTPLPSSSACSSLKEEMAETVEEEVAIDVEGDAEEDYCMVVEEYLNRKDQTIIKKELKMW
eukprot:CAMPEP_0170825002 /NCGR_PEP_ID=MMETSP0733-20121128/45654_1 /TAXON_ID=186038 /ORGANISM="Fragilariopsis kerguelensis, Strain L26-C5" /LENGTH=175 /DNA_ID=CAMNT_0011188387 /DNA_START=209 /DNA_END=734 /DNA_ORIENTATION=-